MKKILVIAILIGAGFGGYVLVERLDILSRFDLFKPKIEYLIRVGDHVLTELDFNQSLEIAKIAYPYDLNKDFQFLKKVKTQVMEQMTEKMLIAERAKELQINITESELKQTIEEITKEYPPGEFEQTLLESSITYKVWTKELEARLLMEKVIKVDLEDRIEITADDLNQYYKELKDTDQSHQKLNNDEPKDVQEVLKQIRRYKAEKYYDDWMKGLQQKYPIDINKELYEKIIHPENS